MSFAAVGCSEPPPTMSLRDLEGTYAAPGCPEVEIAGDMLRASGTVAVKVRLTQIKDRVYLEPETGVVVENGRCEYGHYPWPDLIRVENRNGQLSLLILARSQTEQVRLVRKAVSRDAA